MGNNIRLKAFANENNRLNPNTNGSNRLKSES